MPPPPPQAITLGNIVTFKKVPNQIGKCLKDRVFCPEFLPIGRDFEAEFDQDFEAEV